MEVTFYFYAARKRSISCSTKSLVSINKFSCNEQNQSRESPVLNNTTGYSRWRGTFQDDRDSLWNADEGTGRLEMVVLVPAKFLCYHIFCLWLFCCITWWQSEMLSVSDAIMVGPECFHGLWANSSCFTHDNHYRNSALDLSFYKNSLSYFSFPGFKASLDFVLAKDIFEEPLRPPSSPSGTFLTNKPFLTPNFDVLNIGLFEVLGTRTFGQVATLLTLHTYCKSWTPFGVINHSHDLLSKAAIFNQ